ncbi:hypothetical protein GGF43_004930 [Coemansia sp. RSA 2618]|nr:hypothetical protein GGF43_004930 [Coemansia sp. RSA 2618]
MTLVSSGTGALMGGYVGGKQAGYKYLAERAHRLPKTVQGWFFYHKWKNYRVILGAGKSAARYAPRIGGPVFAFVAMEEILDRVIGQTQMASTVIASLCTAAGVSLIARLPKSSARRACLAGLGVGITIGAMQDLSSSMSGHTPAYVLWAQQRLASK